MADVGNKTRSLEAFGMCLVGGRNDPHWIFQSWASSRSGYNEECILILVVEFLVGTLQKKSKRWDKPGPKIYIRDGRSKLPGWFQEMEDPKK